MLKKLSLAALVAMGSVSFATAADLSEAIKGVKLGGYVRYRHNSTSVHADASNEYKVVAKFTVPVDEKLSLFTKFATKGTTSDEGADAKPTVKTVEAKFIYKDGGFTAIYGKQGIATPLTDKADQYGTGLVAMYKMSDALTVAAARFVNSNIVAGSDITAAAAIGKASDVSYQLWYINAVDELVKHDIFAEVKVKISDALNVTLQGAFAEAAALAGTDENQQLLALEISGKAGVDYKVGATLAGTDGGYVNIGDNDTAIVDAGEQSENYSYTPKATTAYAAVMAPVAKDAALGLDVVMSNHDEASADDEATVEYVLRGCYKYTKKLKISGYYSMLTGDNENSTSRLEVKYTF